MLDRLLISALLGSILSLHAESQVTPSQDRCYHDPELSVWESFEAPYGTYLEWKSFVDLLPSDGAGNHPLNLESNYEEILEYVENADPDHWYAQHVLYRAYSDGCFGLRSDAEKANYYKELSKNNGNVVMRYIDAFNNALGESSNRNKRAGFEKAIEIIQESDSWAFRDAAIEIAEGVSVFETKVAGRSRYKSKDLNAYCNGASRARDLLPIYAMSHHILSRCYQWSEWKSDPVLAYAHRVAYHKLSRTEQSTDSFQLERALNEAQRREAEDLSWRLMGVLRRSEISESPEAAMTDPSELQIMSTGTGFFVSSDVIVTNDHVIDGSKAIQVGIANKAYTAMVIASDADLDLALLRLDSPKLDEAQICFDLSVIAPTVPGTEIYAAGFPLSDLLSSDPKITSGVISSQNGIDNDPKTFQLSAPLQPGNSGGPVFSSDGFLQGVAVATLRKESQNVNFAIKPVFISALLASNGLSASCDNPLSADDSPVAAFAGPLVLVANLQ